MVYDDALGMALNRRVGTHSEKMASVKKSGNTDQIIYQHYGRTWQSRHFINKIDSMCSVHARCSC